MFKACQENQAGPPFYNRKTLQLDIWPDFAAYINTLPEVQSCLQLSGEFDFLLQVSLRDPQEYETFLNEKLCILPVVEKLQSSLVLREHKVFSPLPLSFS